MSEDDDFKLQLSKKTGFSIETIDKLIKVKRDKIGQGYLTIQGALYLIASDFGIILETETIEKISLLDTINIEEISDNDLKTKFNILKSDKFKKSFSQQNTQYFMLMAIALYAFSAGISSPVENDSIFNKSYYLSDENGFEYVIAGITLSIISVTLILIGRRFSQINLNTKELIFLEFYKTYKKIYEFGIRESKDPSKCKNAVNNLSSFIGKWTRNDSPTAISELPDNLSSNLKKNVIPQFRENNSDNIEHFKNTLKKITMFCYAQEPTAELLRAFNDEIKNYKIKKEEKNQTPSSVLSSKLIFLAPVSGICLFLILHMIDPTELHDSIAYSSTLSILSTIALYAVVKRK